METKTYPRRTVQQNKALHVLFKLLADTLNENGLDMRKALKPSIDIPWSAQGVKEYLWRPVQRAQTTKASTTDLTTIEIDEVFDTLNKHIGDKFGLHVNFPSIEDVILQYESEQK